MPERERDKEKARQTKSKAETEAERGSEREHGKAARPPSLVTSAFVPKRYQSSRTKKIRNSDDIDLYKFVAQSYVVVRAGINYGTNEYKCAVSKYPSRRYLVGEIDTTSRRGRGATWCRYRQRKSQR